MGTIHAQVVGRELQHVGAQERNKFIESLTKSDIEALIDECIIGRNAERNRHILKRRLIDGVYFEPLAEEFELSPRQVKDIVYKGTQKIISKLH